MTSPMQHRYVSHLTRHLLGVSTLGAAALVVTGLMGLCLALDDPGWKTPLDLPSGGLGAEDEDERHPETISFYGEFFEGDAFFWCLDTSCTMGWTSDQGGVTPLQELKTEMTISIAQLSEEAEFGMVKFNDTHERWKAQPVTATPARKTDAVQWVQNMTSGGTTCLLEAALSTLQLAHISSRPRPRVILLGDGLPMCPPPNTEEQNQTTLMQITRSNLRRIPIDTIFISGVPGGIELFQEIAEQNDGVFVNPY